MDVSRNSSSKDDPHRSRSRPVLRIDPPSNPFIEPDLQTPASQAINDDDRFISPTRSPLERGRRLSTGSSRSPSLLGARLRRRSSSFSGSKERHDHQLLSPIQKLSSAATRRLSTSSDEPKSPDISLMNELTQLNIDELKEDLVSALGTSNHQGTWLPSSKQSSKNSSTTNLSTSENGIELEPIKKKSSAHSYSQPLVPDDLESQINIEGVSDHLQIPEQNTQRPSPGHSPSKMIGEVFYGLTSKVTGRRSSKRFSAIQDDPSIMESNDEDEEYFPTHGLGLDLKPQTLRLYGHSLRYFGPHNKLRLSLATILLKPWPYYTIRFFIFLQTALLSFRQWNPDKLHGYVRYGSTWADWIILFINILYTVEIFSKIIAFGLWDDSEMFKALNRDYNTIRDRLRPDKLINYFWGPPEEQTEEDYPAKIDTLKHSISFHVDIPENAPLQRAYLRNSWNRLSFTAMVAFWVDFFLTVGSRSTQKRIPLFRALSALRVFELVDLTDKIALILRSLKFGAPQLIDVSLFLVYFWVLFAIIGVQSFKSSLRRTCVWTNPTNPAETFTTSNYCGGYLEPNTLKHMPYIFEDGTYADRAKGFLCPVNSKCVLNENPYGGTVSFDNIVQSMELVFVVMSANTFTDIMYDTMNTDTMAASLFYIFGIFFLYLWLINLLIAVISASFKATRASEHKRSDLEDILTDFKLDWGFSPSLFSRIYSKMIHVFELCIFASFVLQCMRDSMTTDETLMKYYTAEAGITLVLLVEIILRFFLYHGNYSKFFIMKRNWVDLILAIITSIIVIPEVHHKLGHAYDWLRVFQIARFYRVVLVIKFIRQLWAQVWKSITIIFNLSLFYFLLVYLASILYSRYFENFISPEDIDDYQFPLNSLPNTLVALYTITSTENWSEIMYNMQENSPNRSSAVFGSCLFIAWFLLSNSVVLNIFIAIIADSLEVSEKSKRKEQVRKFVLKDFPEKVKNFAEKTFIAQFKNKFFRSRFPDEENQKQVMNLLLNGAAIQEFLQDELNEEDQNELQQLPKSRIHRFFKVQYQRLTSTSWLRYYSYQNPFLKKDHELLGSNIDYSLLPKNYEVINNKNDEEREKFLDENPSYNNVFYILPPEHRLRRLCQRITGPSVGKRYHGVEPNKYLQGTFLTIIASSTLILVIVACYATPLYKKRFGYDTNAWNWTTEMELSFAFLFSIEFLIKVIADGLILTPNAYFLNSWNYIDFAVLISLWINILALLNGYDSLSRVVRGVKALRALRLLTVSDTSRDIFHKVIIAGVWKIIGAAFLSCTLLVPFAAWGVNLFTNRLGVCNDSGMGYDDCYNEYSTTITNWSVIMPRAYDDPQLELNRFASSLLTLFEILSLEGWVDLLQNMVNSSGVRTPAGYWVTPANAVFIMAFNFLGIVFVLALFVSVIINNYSKTTGSGFMTLQQRSWVEVQKLLSQIKPEKKPDLSNENRFRKLCYKTACERNAYRKVFLNIMLWIHILAIFLEMYPSPEKLDTFRYSIYIISSSIFLSFILMKLIGLGPRTFFMNKWNAYEFFVFAGAFLTSLISFFVSRGTAFANINKLFLVGIFTVLIPSSDRLSHLLTMASASLPSLLSLIYTWCILFLVYAIALNQIFGLTRLGPNTTGNLNLRTVTKSLILLFRNSFGEGWNYTMHDFAIGKPFCSEGDGLSNTDCGSMQYAYILFISWNVFSMYIFVNMFISLIFENFSYVYNDNGLKVLLNREEIRKFKVAWQKFDPQGTGFITPEQLPPFLRSLDGYFSFKVFDDKWSIPEITRKCFTRPTKSTDPYDIFVDFAELNKILGQMNVKKVCTNKINYERFIEEAIVNMELNEEKGISFSKIILQIPLYSRFEETNCLTLADFMDRLLLSRKVERRLRSRHHLAALEMIVCRWKFKNRLEQTLSKSSSLASSQAVPQLNPFDSNISDRTDSNNLGIFRNPNPIDTKSGKEPFRYREDLLPGTHRGLTGSLELPVGAVASPNVSTPEANRFTTDDLYWSPPKRKNSNTFYDDISVLSESLDNSEWGHYFKQVDAEQQGELKKALDGKSLESIDLSAPDEGHDENTNNERYSKSHEPSGSSRRIL